MRNKPTNMTNEQTIKHLQSCYAAELDSSISNAVEEIAHQYGVARRMISKATRSTDEELSGITAVRALKAAREDLCKAETAQRV